MNSDSRQQHGGEEGNSPDSLKKSLNFVSCSVRGNLMNCIKSNLYENFNYQGLLVNPADVKFCNSLRKKSEIRSQVVTKYFNVTYSHLSSLLSLSLLHVGITILKNN